MAIEIRDPWGYDSSHYADQVHAVDRPTHSKLLGPDGEPLKYEAIKLGFDLTTKPARGAKT